MLSFHIIIVHFISDQCPFKDESFEQAAGATRTSGWPADTMVDHGSVHCLGRNEMLVP
jgi:hypothetical protein